MLDIDYVLIGKRVKETRAQMKVSQATLAEMTGLSVTYISHIETAYKKASLTSLVSIANAAGISSTKKRTTVNAKNNMARMSPPINITL